MVQHSDIQIMLEGIKDIPFDSTQGMGRIIFAAWEK